MPKTLEAITHDVLELPNSQRRALARVIPDLDAGAADPDAEAAWEEEISARMRAFDEGRLETIPFEKAKVEIEAMLREKSLEQKPSPTLP